jgi:hypothetical protein
VFYVYHFTGLNRDHFILMVEKETTNMLEGIQPMVIMSTLLGMMLVLYNFWSVLYICSMKLYMIRDCFCSEVLKYFQFKVYEHINNFNFFELFFLIWKHTCKWLKIKGILWKVGFRCYYWVLKHIHVNGWK